MRTLIDISVPLRTGIASDPPGLRPQIEYLTHRDTVADVLSFFPGARAEDLPTGRAGRSSGCR